MYDIIYSIIFHQEIDIVNHFLKNIEKYNTVNNYLVIIHLSNELFKIKDKIYGKNVIINCIHYNKRRFTHLTMKPHIENCEYLINNHIKFNNYMLLSSGCRFVRQAPKFEYNNKKLYKKEVEQNISDLKGWHWPKFLKNKNIVDIFQENKIKLIGGQVSGRLYPRNIIIQICKFIRQKKFFYIIQQESVFDEIILPSLFNYYTYETASNTYGYEMYAKIFWHRSNSVPKITDIVKELRDNNQTCIIKRFPNNINHELFKALDNDYFDSL